MVLMIVIMGLLIFIIVSNLKYKELESEVLRKLGFSNWNIVPFLDVRVTVKSRQTLEKYDDIKYFKESREKLSQTENVLRRNKDVTEKLKSFLKGNEFQSCFQYKKIENRINGVIKNAEAFRVKVEYISSAGNKLGEKILTINQSKIDRFKKDPSLLMSKGEYNKYLKEQQREALSKKQHEYYEKVNSIIDYANDNRDDLAIKGSTEQLDNLIAQLFDRTVNSIKRIKSIDSEEWDIIKGFMARIEREVKKVVILNKKILEYYESSDFSKIKETCEVLMSTQRVYY